MNYKIIAKSFGEVCGCCGSDLPQEWGFYDEETHANICPDCRMGSILAVGQLNAVGIKGCIQVSGGEELENGGDESLDKWKN